MYGHRRRLQNKVAESSITLPAAAVLAALLWWLPQGSYSNEALAGWAVYALTTYVLIELTNVNVLLRVRSRLTSSIFITLLAVCGFVHQLQPATIAALAVVCALYALFTTYERRQLTAPTFHSYLLLSLGSLALPPLLLLMPVLLFCQGVYMRSLSWRTFMAALIGTVVPYWIWAAIATATATFVPLQRQALAIVDPINAPILAVQSGQSLMAAFYQRLWDTLHSGTSLSDLNYALLLPAHLRAHVSPLSLVPLAAAAVVVGVLGLTGFVHYVRSHYDDKIRVRMCFHTLLTLQVVVTLWLLVQPRQLPHLLPLLMLTTAAPVAHFFSLTHSRGSNFWFVCCWLLLVAVGIAALALPYFFEEAIPAVPAYDLSAIVLF